MDERYPKLCPMQYFFSFNLCIYFVFAFDAVLDSFKKSLNQHKETTRPFDQN